MERKSRDAEIERRGACHIHQPLNREPGTVEPCQRKNRRWLARHLLIAYAAAAMTVAGMTSLADEAPWRFAVISDTQGQPTTNSPGVGALSKHHRQSHSRGKTRPWISCW